MNKKFLIFLVFGFISVFVFSSTKYKFIKVSPSGSYFELNGKAFIPIGFNYGVDWPLFSGLWTGSVGGIRWGNPKAVESFFSDLHSHGVNTLRIFLEDSSDPSNSADFENPLGTINTSLINVWNYIFKYAKENDIYLIIEPFDPFWMSKNWDKCPFNVKNGGPINSLDEFLTNKEVIKDTEFRFKFMIDKWGKTSHILAWEINNEIDLWYGHNNSSAIKKYIETIASFIINYENSKFGEHHLITVSTAAPVLNLTLADVIYKNKNLDFVTTHLYLPAANNPTNTIDPAIEVAQAVLRNLEKMNYSKPYFDSEDGPINGWFLPSSSIDEYYHNMLWAEFSSGGSSPGLRWPYLSSSYISGLDIYEALSKFVSSPGINWINFKPYSSVHELKIRDSDTYVIPFSCGDQNARVIWLLKDTRKNLKDIKFSNIKIAVSNLKNGKYVVEFWNTYFGRMLNSTRFEVKNGTLNFTIDLSNLNDVALKLYRIGSG